MNDNLSTQICANKFENRITFKIKLGYSLKLLTPETTKLLGSFENKKTKEKNGKNVSHLEMTKVILIHCNLANNSYQQDSRALYAYLNKSFGTLFKISPANFMLLKTF